MVDTRERALICWLRGAMVLAALMLTGAGAGAAPGGGESRQAEVLAGRPQIPDVQLVDQDGSPVHFYRDLIEGRVVAINFIFTRCRMVCPILGLNFAAARRELGPEVELVSVSVDPVTDTPARLKAWGEKMGVGPGWTLVTGPKQEVDRLLKALQAFTADRQEHTTLVLLGNEPRGEWKRVDGLTSAAVLVAELERWLGGS